MAQFYDVPIKWRDEKETKGRGIGNNAAWVCLCGEILLGPHSGTFIHQIPPCPSCGRKFSINRGEKPNYVAGVEEETK
jgi:hypothetical protein